jgi:hypothetical protein
MNGLRMYGTVGWGEYLDLRERSNTRMKKTE